MYSISGLPWKLVSVVSLIDRSGRPVAGNAPVPTLDKVLTGTLVIWLVTDVGRLPLPFWLDLVRPLPTKMATTITVPVPMAPAQVRTPPHSSPFPIHPPPS